MFEEAIGVILNEGDILGKINVKYMTNMINKRFDNYFIQKKYGKVKIDKIIASSNESIIFTVSTTKNEPNDPNPTYTMYNYLAKTFQDNVQHPYYVAYYEEGNGIFVGLKSFKDIMSANTNPFKGLI